MRTTIAFAFSLAVGCSLDISGPALTNDGGATAPPGAAAPIVDAAASDVTNVDATADGAASSPTNDGATVVPAPTSTAPLLPPTTGTQLGALAASLSPGTWGVLATTNMEQTLGSADVGGGASSGILGYAEGAVWDPTSQRILFMGSDHNWSVYSAKFVSFEAATSTWSVMPRPPFVVLATAHGYDHPAIDAARGRFFMRSAYDSRTFWKYEMGAAAWSALPANDVLEYSQCCGGAAYFPGVGLVWAQAGEALNGTQPLAGLFVFDETKNAWRRLARDLPMGAYHNFAEYNPVHDVVLFGGGNDYGKKIYELKRDGTVTALPDAPIGLGTMQAVVTVDPVSGDYLAFGTDGSLHVLDIVTRTWRQAPGKDFFAPVLSGAGAVWQVVATPVSTYGVVAFAKYNYASSALYLYKHAQAGP